MRCALVCVVAVLIAAPAAGAARAQLTIQVTPAAGPAPLHVTFAATGAESVHWDFGDGTSADGPTVAHVYAAGQWTATATADSERATVVVTASGLTLNGPKLARYGRRAVFRGTVIPAEAGVAVTIKGPSGKAAAAKTTTRGTYAVKARVRTPGDYVATSARGASAPASVRVVPKLLTSFTGSAFSARLAPARAGALTVTVMRGSHELLNRTAGWRVRVKLDPRRFTSYRIRVAVAPNEGYAATARIVRAGAALRRLSFGAHNAAVAFLGDQLRRLHYAAPYGAAFDGRMLDAVYAFQKVQGLPRTGAVDTRLWRALENARTPIPRYAQPASHLEVNKPRQVLYVVRGSRVALIVPVSTAGLPGKYTPSGRFAVYRKVVGFDPSPLGTLYDPMYFTGGYAIHGNPSVPPYPASHGCVRVPMWVAPHLYATIPYGETVYVY
ncbi:MAG: L,D-transpeptidase family protein [Gaiellaceae bacterium]